MEIKFTTCSPKETANLGERLGRAIKGKCTLAFLGDLGAGKTCFTLGLAKGLEYFGEANSPTFAIVNEYLGGRLPIYHFDMYRITSEDDLYSVGFYDYLEQNGVTVVEWSENVDYALPPDTVFIEITVAGESKRNIVIKSNGDNDFLKEI